jgi:hypothetical protein
MLMLDVCIFQVDNFLKEHWDEYFLLRSSNRKLGDKAAQDYRGLKSDLERATAEYPDASILQATPKHKATTSKAAAVKLTSAEYSFIKSHKTLEMMKVNAIRGS